MGRFQFFLEGLKHYKEVGTVLRSSPSLSKKAVSFIDPNKDACIIELGAGDGVMTKFILDKMSSGSKLMSIELNEKLFEQLSQIKDDRLICIQGSVEHLDQFIADHQLPKADYIISIIPFIIFPKEKASEILSTCKKCMKDGASYIQIHYAKTLKKFYEGAFGNLKSHFVISNIPPAYVFVCENKPDSE